MSFPDDLLEQARHLLTVDQGGLEQVNLRRVVSACYYALFHLLGSSASSLFTSDEKILAKINRSFDHGKIKQVSSMVEKDEWFKSIESLAPTFPSDSGLRDRLKVVAAAFVALQGMRHKADYNLDPDLVYSRDEARSVIQRAQEAFECWREIETTDLARLYLASFLLPSQWSKDLR